MANDDNTLFNIIYIMRIVVCFKGCCKAIPAAGINRIVV